CWVSDALRVPGASWISGGTWVPGVRPAGVSGPAGLPWISGASGASRGRAAAGVPGPGGGATHVDSRAPQRGLYGDRAGVHGVRRPGHGDRVARAHARSPGDHGPADLGRHRRHQHRLCPAALTYPDDRDLSERTMFERFTDRARRTIVLAQEEARMLNHNYIG